jgi:hypothetical protein
VDRMQLLKKISFGARVAEDETGELGNYFVETDQWDRVFGGEIDVIKGDKGAGKSAIYSLLSAKSDELFDKRILLITAEEPRGTPVFKELVTEPPAAEAEFVGLWKLYLLSLIAKKLQEYDIKNDPAKKTDRTSFGSRLDPAKLRLAQASQDRAPIRSAIFRANNRDNRNDGAYRRADFQRKNYSRRASGRRNKAGICLS